MTPKPEKSFQRPAAEDRQAFLNAFQRVVGEVFRLNGRLLATAERLSKGLEIGPAGWQTVAVIRDEPMTVSQMSRRLGLRRQSVQRNVNVLKKQGLVDLQPNPAHRRAYLVTLTPRGREVMDILRDRQADLTVEFTRELELSVADLDDLATNLQRLREQAEKAGAG